MQIFVDRQTFNNEKVTLLYGFKDRREIILTSLNLFENDLIPIINSSPSKKFGSTTITLNGDQSQKIKKLYPDSIIE